MAISSSYLKNTAMAQWFLVYMGFSSKKWPYQATALVFPPPSNCAILNTGEHIVIENFVMLDNREVFLIGRKFLNVENMYDYPMPSKDLGMCVASNLSDHLGFWNIKLIKCKAIKTRFKDASQLEKCAIVSLLHFD